MKVVFISIFLCVLSCIVWVENARLVAENVMDDVSDKAFDATSSTIRESLFPASDIQMLPASFVEFEEIRLNGGIFVDKTAFIKKLLELQDVCGMPFVIICRPRRFGKTIFLRMLKQFFLGNKKFFNNTAIAELMPGEWTKYPVIYISFNFAPAINTLEDVAKFKLHLKMKLYLIGNRYKLDIDRIERIITIDLLIRKLKAEKGLPVVVLIDEYDNIFHKASNANEEVFNTLKMAVATFYDQIKGQAHNIKVLFITGISRMSLNYFNSGLSLADIEDLTFSKDFSTAMGFTLQEITSNFGPSLQRLAIKNGKNYSSIIKSIITWYDGYRFSPEDSTKVINPISIITALREEKIGNYWGITYSNRPIIKTNKEFQEFLYYNISLSKITAMYNDEHRSTVPLAALLYNYGYLTIFGYNEKLDIVFLTYPNQEIKSVILNELSQSQSPD